MGDRNDAPAFPVAAGNQVYATGLTLRDWFAGQALPAMIGAAEGQPDSPEDAANFFSKLSYIMADAMLEARK